MISLDFTVVIQIINFLVIVFVAKKMIYEPMLSNIENRDNKISRLISASDSLKSEIATSKKEYEEKLQKVRAEVAEYQKNIREQTLKEAAEKLSKVKEEVTSEIASARSELEKAVVTARASLEKEAEQLSQVIIEKIIGKAA